MNMKVEYAGLFLTVLGAGLLVWSSVHSKTASSWLSVGGFACWSLSYLVSYFTPAKKPLRQASLFMAVMLGLLAIGQAVWGR